MKKEMLSTLSPQTDFPGRYDSLLNYKQESQIYLKIAANNFIHGTCLFSSFAFVLIDFNL